MFEKITAFLPELNKSSYGSVGFHENDMRLTKPRFRLWNIYDVKE